MDIFQKQKTELARLRRKTELTQEMGFSRYMEYSAGRILHIFLLAQVILVPLHIFTTDYIDESVRFSMLSVASRLVSAISFVIIYFLVKRTKTNYQFYVGVTFFINAVGDAYLASLSSEQYLVTHMLGLAVVFIAYALIIVWKPIFYQLTLYASLLATAILFYLHNDLPIIVIMKEGGGFLIFLVAISIIINYMRFSNLKSQYENLTEIHTKNEELQASEEELRQNLEELEASQENLKLQKESLEITMMELNNTQQQLITAERIASIGSMTNGIAHEINNPLNFISGGLQALKSFLPDYNDMSEICSKMNLEGQSEEVVTKVKELRK